MSSDDLGSWLRLLGKQVRRLEAKGGEYRVDVPPSLKWPLVAMEIAYSRARADGKNEIRWSDLGIGEWSSRT
ncbi:MAG: hypothetical protein ACT4OP_12090 [Actinomycetota bacterium]